jgi:hypothetical protein
MRTRRWGAVAAGLLLVAACGEDEPNRAAGDPLGPPLPPEVAALWAEDDPLITIAPPTTSWLPTEDGGRLTSVRVAEPGGWPALPGPPVPNGPAQTLYLDPTAADPATARALMVGRVELSDTDGALPVPGGEHVTVGGADGELTEVGGLVVVTWPRADAGEVCACDQDLFVAGRGVARDAVLAAAEAADPLAPIPALPPEATDGLEPLGTSPMVLGWGLSGWLWSQTVEVERDGLAMVVSVATADPRLVEHARFWAPEGATASRWDRPLAAAQLDDATVAVATSTHFGGGAAVPIDLATAVPLVESAAAALVPATPEEVAAAQQQAFADEPVEPCDAGPGDQVDITGTTGDTRWIVGIAHGDDGLLVICEAGRGLDGSSGPGPVSAGHQDLDLTGPIEVVGRTGGLVTDGGASRQTIIGHVRAGATTVEVIFPGAAAAPAVLADTGPTPDRRWFAVVVEATVGGDDPGPTVVARDATGAEIGRTGP